MAPEIVFVGYTCNFCGQRVPVLRSSEPPKAAKDIIVECKCGLVRRISVAEIQDLDVWKESAGSS